MPEIILLPFIIGLLIFPQVGAYYFAKHLGRNPKLWLGISFVLPVISLFILIFLPDVKSKQIDDEQ